MKWLRQWVRRMVYQAEEDMKRDSMNQSDRVRPATSIQDVLGHMSNSMAQIYRIDNGFIMTINMNSHDNYGGRGACVYAKDAGEVAEKIIAHETAFKLGVNKNSGVTPGGFAVPSQAFIDHSRDIYNEAIKNYEFKKGVKDYV